jgi:hypothetical protein
MADSRVRVILEAVLTNFTKGIGQAKTQLQDLGKVSSQAGKQGRQMFQQMNSSVRNARGELEGLRMLIGSLFSMYAGKKLIDFTIGNASEFENYLLRYSVLLKSMDAAQERMQEMRDFAIFTPYQLDEVVKADLLLESYGIRSIELLRVAGDAAAGTGQEIEEVAFWLGRIASGDTGYGLMRLAEMSIVTRTQLQAMGLEFDNAGAYVGSLDDLMNALATHMQSKYPGMMDKLAVTGKGLWSTIQDVLGEFGRDIGFKSLDNAKESAITFINELQRLRDDGTLDVWTQRIGDALSWVFEQLTKFVADIEQTGNKLAGFFKWFGDNWYWISEAILFAVQAWLIFKASMAVEPIIYGVATAISVLSGMMTAYSSATTVATGITAAFGVALKAVGIGWIIAIIGLVILAIVKLVQNWDSAKNWILYGCNAVLLAFQMMGYGIMVAINLIMQMIAWMTSWIPGIGDAMEIAAQATNDALASVRTGIDDTINRMAELRNAALTASEAMKDVALPEGPPTLDMEAPGAGDVPKFEGLGSRGGSGKKKSQDAIDLIDDEYKYQIQISEGKANLHDNDTNKTMWKQLMLSTVEVLKAKLQEVTAIASTATGKLQEKAEAKKYEILNRIQDITEEIKDNTAKLVQDFGTPSFINSTSLKQFRASTMATSAGFTVSGANFVFELQEAPRTEDDWKDIFKTSEDALAHFLDNRRRRG